MPPRSSNNMETEHAQVQGKTNKPRIEESSSSSSPEIPVSKDNVPVDDIRTENEKEADRKVCLYLPILVTLDMFAVSLVVPLLNRYYINAGIASARQREFMSSAFTSSQIIGGILIGAAGDAGILSRKKTLLLSFIGSAFAYGVIGFAGHSFYAVVISRVMIGLVKQTMTVGTALLVRHTTKAERATQMGRLNSTFTVAWMVGPSVGGYLFKNIGPSTPAMFACAIFAMITFVGVLVLPESNDGGEKTDNNKIEVEKEQSSTMSKQTKLGSFRSNLRSCFTSKSLTAAIISLLLFNWVTRATSYQSISSFYEDMYGIETHQRGYLTSYRSLLTFFIQNSLVRPLLEKAGSESHAAVYASFVLAFTTLLESRASLSLYLTVVCPLVSTCVAILGLSLKALLTQVAPKDTIGSALAALDILQNVVNISVPFYRTALFAGLEYLTTCVKGGVEECEMSGDPEPGVWLLSGAFHWFCFALVIAMLLPSFRGKVKVS
mmetsp:Transcript_6519/g.9538  ORF Transcript_6519/g.9538 Transcript_6519/m.9538 type:complete len:492 (-) Transcript_6519:183-1658(-)